MKRSCSFVLQAKLVCIEMKLHQAVGFVRQEWVQLIKTWDVFAHDVVNTQYTICTLAEDQATQVRYLKDAITQYVQDMKHD